MTGKLTSKAMADKRKHQIEIDRCLKRVVEGGKQFDDIWQKLQSAGNSYQKEKHEAVLKKEIKKLQRLRDQLKTWIASDEIKDKQQLVEHRKLIEVQMERFKELERESKTKAYSKEGLVLTPKFDPAVKEKEETAQWLTSTIASLNMQVDQFEGVVESLLAQTGKKKGERQRQDRITELRTSIEKHRFHLRMLETIGRKLDNDLVSVDFVQKIKDDVTYYVDTSQEPDFEENEFLYDGLDLEEIPAALGGCVSPGRAVSPTASATSLPASPTPATHTSRDKKGPQQTDNDIGPSSVKNGAPHLPSVSPSLSSLARAKAVVPTSNGPVGLSGVMQQHQPPQQQQQQQQRHAQPPSQQQLPQMKTGLSTSNNAHSSIPVETRTHPTAAPSGVITNRAGPAPSSSTEGAWPLIPGQSAISVARNANRAPDRSACGPKQSYSAVVAEGSTESVARPNPYRPKPGGVSYSAVVAEASAESLARPPKQNGTSSYSAVVAEAPTESVARLPPSYSAVVAEGSTESALGTPSKSRSRQPSPVGRRPIDNPGLVSSVTVPLSSLPPLRPDYKAPGGVSHSHTQPSKSLKEMAERSVLGSRLHPKTTNPCPPVRDGPSLSLIPEETPAAPQQPSLSEVRIPLSLGACPLGSAPLTKAQQYQQAMQEAAWRHLPHATDSDRARNCPVYHTDSIEFYHRLTPETLFFIFYYLEGTRAQYLSAQVLKKQSWMFHNKYMMWFQRHGEPKIITTGEFEQGSYICFDYVKWDWRQLEGFVLEYRYLEDI